MSRNLSRTLFYEFYKSDPNFIYESVEEYRNYKSDPEFADKTIEEYRRVKALQKKEMNSIHEFGVNEEETSSDESQNSNENCGTHGIILTENETETENDTETEPEIENKNEENDVDKLRKEITELKVESMAHQEFERSLEQFWKTDDAETLTFDSRSSSRCSSETLSRLTSETELSTSKKRTKAKFKIPKCPSTPNFRKTKSRYMDVFKKS